MTQICSMPIGICLFLAALFGYEIFKRSHHHHHHHQFKIVSISFNRYSVHAQGRGTHSRLVRGCKELQVHCDELSPNPVNLMPEKFESAS